jgi:hypothetical protein
MALTRRALSSAMLCALASMHTRELRAQNPSSPEARVKVIFRAFDLNESGWLSGREVTACDCRAYDANRNGEITWEEFRAGWARAPLIGGSPLRSDDDDTPRPAAQRPPAARPAPQATASRFRPGDRVEIYADGRWSKGSVVQAQNGRYRVSRDDNMYGVTTSDEWIPEARLRTLVATPAAAPPPTSAMPRTVPMGSYECVIYGGGVIGKLRILGAGVSSGVSREESGAQYRFTYDPASGAINWTGLTIAGYTVERAEYRPETDGTPNINLHYRRQAGGNLNSMSCARR